MFLAVSRVFRGIMGCSRGVPGLFRAVPGCSGGVPGMFRGVPGVFRGVPGCSGFYRHPRTLRRLNTRSEQIFVNNMEHFTLDGKHANSIVQYQSVVS